MHKKHAFTLIELLTVIAVIAILSAIIIPTLNGVRERAKVTTNFSNLRQIYAASQMYASEHDGRVPPSYLAASRTHWMQHISPYVSGENSKSDGGDKGAGYLASDVLISPRWEDSPRYRPDAYWVWGYGMNEPIMRPDSNTLNRVLEDPPAHWEKLAYFNQIPFPATTVLVGESADWHFHPNAMDLERWDGESHVLYADGRVESALPEKVRRLVADPADR